MVSSAHGRAHLNLIFTRPLVYTSSLFQSLIFHQNYTYITVASELGARLAADGFLSAWASNKLPELSQLQYVRYYVAFIALFFVVCATRTAFTMKQVVKISGESSCK
jgi:hypothetical protein